MPTTTSTSWTPDRLAQLRKLPVEGVPNKDIATALDVPVTAVYAKRSQLGITIDKVSGSNPPASRAAAVDEIYRRKRVAIHKLQALIRTVDPAIDRLEYKHSDHDEQVVVYYNTHMSVSIDVTADSVKAMLIDVLQSI